MSKHVKDIPLYPVQVKELSPAEYLRTLREDEDNIASAHIKPPTLGSSNFGKVVVRFKRPRFIALENG